MPQKLWMLFLTDKQSVQFTWPDMSRFACHNRTKTSFTRLLSYCVVGCWKVGREVARYVLCVTATINGAACDYGSCAWIDVGPCISTSNSAPMYRAPKLSTNGRMLAMEAPSTRALPLPARAKVQNGIAALRRQFASLPFCGQQLQKLAKGTKRMSSLNLSFSKKSYLTLQKRKNGNCKAYLTAAQR